MIGFLHLIKAEWLRSFIVMRRYWFRSIIGLVLGYGMMLMLVYGFIYSQDTIADRVGAGDQAINFVLGFIIGMFAFGIVGMYTQGLQGMASTGILEQLCMSPYGLITNFMARTVVGAISMIFSSSILVWAIATTVGGELHFSLVPVLVLLALTFLNLLGFGLMVGGLVLVFKQVGQVAMILRMVLFGLAIFAREEVVEKSNFILAGLLHLLPITDGAICIKYVLLKGQMQGEELVPVYFHPSFFFLVLNCFIWIVAGVACFKYMENYSRYKGTLGTY